MTLKAWKFLFSGERPHPTINGATYRGTFLAVAIAPSADEARAFLKRRAVEEGDDANWLDCIAQPIEIDLVSGARLAWVMTN